MVLRKVDISWPSSSRAIRVTATIKQLPNLLQLKLNVRLVNI